MAGEKNVSAPHGEPYGTIRRTMPAVTPWS